MRAFVTGIGGFAGSHLAEFLLAQGIEVSGMVRHGHAGHAAGVQDRVRLYPADLSDQSAIHAALEDAAPDLVFHLAGQANVPRSWQDPEGTYRTNVLGQLHLLEAVAAVCPAARVLVVGSNEEYGPPRPDELPIRETNPLRPASPYAVTKAAQDLMGYQYFLGRKLQCIRVRPFNHIGPRQDDGFVAPAFARQVAEAELGLRPPVVWVGNLAAQRDFTDVRDMVRGYYLVLTRGTPGEVYNLGSGRPVSAQALLEYFLAQAKVRLQVEVDPARFRPVDVPLVACDASKARAATGWEPTLPLERTLQDILDDWRMRVRTTRAHPSAASEPSVGR
ncbi:MAG: GDP-mannose 4,6-dehydratase [Chloroflexi bacterium]|nr:GDP-mannose 4,6-dehydratase [Chloroflexota bacterium]